MLCLALRLSIARCLDGVTGDAWEMDVLASLMLNSEAGGLTGMDGDS